MTRAVRTPGKGNRPAPPVISQQQINDARRNGSRDPPLLRLLRRRRHSIFRIGQPRPPEGPGVGRRTRQVGDKRVRVGSAHQVEQMSIPNAGGNMNAAGIDEAKLEAFMGQAVTDMGAIISAPLMVCLLYTSPSPRD